MFITFYDENFIPLINNSSLNIEKFKLKKRSYDTNEFSCTCEPISVDIEPLFATIKNNQGERQYDMLRPIITIDKGNKSNVIARDLFAVFNTEVFIDFSTFSGITVAQFFQFIFNKWKAWDSSGFTNVVLNLNFVDLSGPLYRPAILYTPTESGVYNILDLFKRALSLYGLYIDSEINIHPSAKSLEFTIRKSDEYIQNIRLEDFGIENFQKYEPSVNTAIVYATRAGGTIRDNWYLLKDGTISANPVLRDVFPTRSQIFYVDGDELDENNSGKTQAEKNAAFADAVNEATFNAVSELAKNRYKEMIAVNIIKDYDRLKNVGFNTCFNVYYRNQFYKTLPIGEIEEDGTENRILRIGLKELNFIQIIW
jgi:hypothetical protein